MRGKLTRTLMAALGLVAVVVLAGTKLGVTAGAMVLALMLGGIGLIQVGAHGTDDGS